MQVLVLLTLEVHYIATDKLFHFENQCYVYYSYYLGTDN